MISIRRLLRKLLPLTALSATALAMTSCTTYVGEGGYGASSYGYNYAPAVSQVYVAPRAYCAPRYYAPSYYGSSCYSRPYGYSSIGYGSIGIGFGGHGYGGGYGYGGHGHGGYGHCN